ncbi:terminase [Tsukamurella tyrosinosolvens]|uniref:terminase n=1 Tax=Tsukamurella tyrosinosolvens TaxID=57704 RepID=UPI002DD43709|nr:terminase [Tsukamurella tyrosinosolvens]MEC4616204.1 terminase [Tsukamurella tyrosinosolvens]
MLILALREDGEYAADTIVISIPRQVGKTYIIGCIIFALCLMKPGLKVIWTAQVKDTALETFEKFYEMAKGPKVLPHIAATPQGKGDEAIVFNNGSKIEFGARDSGFGRGRTDVDVLVFDEGQHLSLQALENMGAAQNVATNPLCFVMGTPPRPQDKGEFFTVMREEAVAGDSDGTTLYIEMSADDGCDPMDRDQWRKANPSFPHRTSERAMLRLRKKLRNEDSWRREALGVWDDVSSHLAAVKMSLWADQVGPGPQAGVAPSAFGVDMSHGRDISIAACWLDEGDDTAHIEEVWRGTDEAAAVQWVVANAGRRPVVIDNASPASSMQPELQTRRVNVRRSSGTDMARACGLVESRLTAGTLTHGDQKSVTSAAKGAQKRPIGTAGGWGYDRRDSTVSIFPLVAAALALFGATADDRRHRGGATFV